MFDDGYLCLKSLYYLPVQKNYIEKLPAFDSSCFHPSEFSNVLSTTNLNVSEADSSIFVSYSFLATEITFTSARLLAYISNKGSEIITLTYTNQPITGFTTNHAFISLYVNLSHVDDITIHPNEPFWIGIWTDLNSVQLIVKSHGYFLFKSTSGFFASK